jgi:hypothetical chaperone protein
MSRTLGLDFGTTNTVLSQVGDDRTAHPLAFDLGGDVIEAMRTVLCFWKASAGNAGNLNIEAGPHAIRQFIDHPDDCRFIQSFKTFAASALFVGTIVYGKRYRFEDLLEAFFGRISRYAAPRLDALPKRLVVGRPVKFAGYQPDAALAIERYDAALRRFGFDEILYVYEPVAAAFFFARNLKRSATVLVADFGGGTTDYSIIRFDVSSGALSAQPLGYGGIGIAGDHFDYRIIDNVILPKLGKDTHYREMGKTLEIPRNLFTSFARWNLLSVLKASNEFRDLKQLVRRSLEPEKLQRFVDLVEEDQGFPLYKAVSEAKARLSSQDEAELSFAPLGPDFRVRLRRTDFERWIAGDLDQIEGALDDTMRTSNVTAPEIDKVFLTGGTSFVPAVRRIFERRFGPERIESGDELLSIANGLALIGEREDAEIWTAREGAANGSIDRRPRRQ